MSQPDDKRELSGLARSIDALFQQPTRSAPPAEAASAPLDETPASPEMPEPDSEEEATPSESSGFSPPADEPFDAWEVSFPTESGAREPEAPEPPAEPEAIGPDWVGAGTGDDSTADWVSEDAPPTAELAVEPALGSEPVALDGRELEVRETEPASGPDPDALEPAVDAFLAGSPGAAAEVRELAELLREKLALDPVADAVERLVREAGDPPDPTFLDMAESIIDPAVASRIVQRIGHERHEERLAEYRVLCRRLGEVMARAFRGALTGATEDDARRAYYDMLVAMSDTCRPIIEEMVEDENTLLMRSGIALLGEIGGERAGELVTSGLAHPDKRVRREALLSLAKLGDEESGLLVMGFLEDPDPDVRVAAATAAGELRVERALKPLLALLDAAGHGEDAIPFIDALGKLGDPGAVPAIEKHAVKTLFSKPRLEVRVAAYRALHRIGTPHARELVEKALDAKEPGVWAAVRQLVAAERES